MCTSPRYVTVRSKLGPFSLLAPCGKCCECKKSVQNSWFCRLYQQLKSSGKAVFFTLTYNEDTVPMTVDESTGEAFRTVCKEDVQKWLKRERTRRMRNNQSKFSYFICSEYGPRTLRPHLHGILFGLSVSDSYRMFLEWNVRFGFTSQYDITLLDGSKNCRYVSKYCSKGVFENPLVELGKVAPTFKLISKGLGLSYLTEQVVNYHLARDWKYKKFDTDMSYRSGYGWSPRTSWNKDFVREVLNRSRMVIEGFSYGLPRYYKDKIYGSKVLHSSSNRSPLYKSTLRFEMFNLICQDVIDLRESRAKELQASDTRWSFNQAYGLVSLREDDVRLCRSKEARSSLGDFYDRSCL